MLQSLLLSGVTHHLTGLLTEDLMYQSTTKKPIITLYLFFTEVGELVVSHSTMP